MNVSTLSKLPVALLPFRQKEREINLCSRDVNICAGKTNINTLSSSAESESSTENQLGERRVSVMVAHSHSLRAVKPAPDYLNSICVQYERPPTILRQNFSANRLILCLLPYQILPMFFVPILRQTAAQP